MSEHFDSHADLRRHFEADQVSESPKETLSFSETQWEYQAVRKYLDEPGKTGPLVKTVLGWDYTP